MTDFAQEYRAKLRTVPQILDLIHSHDTIVAGSSGDEPIQVLRELHTIADRVEDVKVLLYGLPEPFEFATNPAYRGSFRTVSSFSDRNTRAAHDARTISFVPSHGHDAVDTARRGLAENPEVYIGQASAPDRNGFVSFGGGTGNFWQAHKAKTVIIGINPNIPHTSGYTELHISDIDYFYEAEERPLHSLADVPPANDVELAIGRNVAGLIADGSTIQLGVGKAPAASAQFLADKNDLGIHSEMMPGSLLPLIQSGVINGRAKTFLPYKHVAAFPAPFKEFYEYIDYNPSFLFLPISYVNSADAITRHRRMVSVNSALQVDLTGQIDSETLGSTQFSGTGGAADFAIGASRAPEGKSIIAIPSTAGHGEVSRIQPVLSPGSVVSISRNDIDYVVTEYGVAALRGVPVDERVRRLIAIAHPKFRDELTEGAERYRLW
ncbi:acetyl-CoA hydrolase/transferase family protein [Bifidobacterium avesanii]|uniref:4-hydroxybutyrate CoA-transferase n=1 Tax=Bifidobacterium avesanii TaxID=1798157 RepID=A0A7K3TI25_9BIFI|nr:acetyl-CoA hydrolase/transferase C-terminal domain-containing protein [Bifidobacterium avesanii]KAB8291455.1 acetyl-CoA hydrolase [Bifidobacterium avesanii]NEG77913.1 hypothetical protein [Bifidobacterium avesanii]